MGSPIFSSRLAYRLFYLGFAVAVLFTLLLPLQTTPRGWAAPDFLMALTFAWILRRPDYVPATMIALVMLLMDFLLQRPPGLQAGLILIGSEFLRSRMILNRELPFLVEWALVASVVFGIALLERIILMLVLLDPPSLGLSFVQAIATVAAYPLIVLFSTHILGISKASRGDVDPKGRLV